MPTIKSFPFRGSAIVYWDGGPQTPPAPELNQPTAAARIRTRSRARRRRPASRSRTSCVNGVVNNVCGGRSARRTTSGREGVRPLERRRLKGSDPFSGGDSRGLTPSAGATQGVGPRLQRVAASPARLVFLRGASRRRPRGRAGRGGVAAPAGLARRPSAQPRPTWVGCWPRSCGIKALDRAGGAAADRRRSRSPAAARRVPPLGRAADRGPAGHARRPPLRRARSVGAVTARLRVAGRGGSWSARSRLIRVVQPPVGRRELGDSPTGTAFDGDGMWIWIAGAARAAASTRSPRAPGETASRTVFLKSGDGDQLWASSLPAIVSALKRRGLKVCAWQYVYGQRARRPRPTSRRARVRNGADCFVIDAEAEYEGRYAQAHTYIAGLRARRRARTTRSGSPASPTSTTTPPSPTRCSCARAARSSTCRRCTGSAIGDDGRRASTPRPTPDNRLYERPIFPLGQVYRTPTPAEICALPPLAARLRRVRRQLVGLAGGHHARLARGGVAAGAASARPRRRARIRR